MRTNTTTMAAVAALLLALAGCRSSPRPMIAEETAAAPGTEEAPPAAPPAPDGAVAPAKSPATGEDVKDAKDERKPYRIGDFIIYPLNWRNAEETAFRLYVILYPKYGPYLQIVPDPHTNSLLIYLPPEGLRASTKTDA
jgi:hypothetical protein